MCSGDGEYVTWRTLEKQKATHKLITAELQEDTTEWIHHWGWR